MTIAAHEVGSLTQCQMSDVSLQLAPCQMSDRGS